MHACYRRLSTHDLKLDARHRDPWIDGDRKAIEVVARAIAGDAGETQHVPASCQEKRRASVGWHVYSRIAVVPRIFVDDDVAVRVERGPGRHRRDLHAV